LYKIEFLLGPQEFYQRLYHRNKSHFDRIQEGLFCLSENPFQGKALKHAFKGQYSFRAGGYRIIYKIMKEAIIINHVQ